MKIKKGDNVIVLSGKDKGRKGKIIKVLPKEGRAVVENVNLKKKHLKPKKGGQKGEKASLPRPVSASSLMLVCKQCGKPARTGSKLESGKKIRICKKCGQET